MKTLVLQSCRATDIPDWIAACLDSVRRWAASQGHDYAFIGDELFDRVPPWYRDKVAGRPPVLADYARLALLREALEAGRADIAVWLDADTLIFDPALNLAFSGTCAFGQEVWVQGEGRELRAVRNVHNAACAFTPDCPVLPFLMQTVLSLIRRVDPARIAPQMVGPKLLTALHNIAGFSLLPQVGALSPAVIADLGTGGGRALDLLRAKSPVPLQAANLCASVAEPAGAERAIEVLLAKGCLF